eukprot:gene1767-2038_t
MNIARAFAAGGSCLEPNSWLDGQEFFEGAWEDTRMTTLTRADWEQRAKDLKIEGRAYINGEYTAAVSGDTFECLSPVDGRLLATVASCDVADAQRAVENARATFNSGAWSRLAPAKRKATMIRFAGLLKANAEELALLETLDMGKPISDSLNIDVPGAAQALSWSGEAIDKIYDEVAATPHDQLGLVTREPIAKQLLIRSGESNMKRVWLEAGGKSPNIVFADAPDLQAAAESAAGAIAFNQGEVCTAGSRLLVERSIKDKFLPLVIEALKAWKPGNPLDPATTVGALVDTQQMNTVLSYIEAGHAHLTAKALRAGSVWVNQYDGGDMTAPFGGFKQSGNGRDKSLHAFDKYTELKATWIKL